MFWPLVLSVTMVNMVKGGCFLTVCWIHIVNMVGLTFLSVVSDWELNRLLKLYGLQAMWLSAHALALDQSINCALSDELWTLANWRLTANPTRRSFNKCRTSWDSDGGTVLAAFVVGDVTQPVRGVVPMLLKRWATVCDAGPTLQQQWMHASCLVV